ncbi:MAG: DUF2281 domain-containing protein [Anaerolineae bacterium]
MKGSMDSAATKEQILQALDELPEESLAEVSQFLEYLNFKAKKSSSTKRVVKLGGLWEDVPFDVTDDEVRELRRAVTHRLLEKEL